MLDEIDPIVLHCGHCRSLVGSTLAQLRDQPAYRCPYCDGAGVPDAYDLVQAMNQRTPLPAPVVRLRRIDAGLSGRVPLAQ
jgi:hypothetical protein